MNIEINVYRLLLVISIIFIALMRYEINNLKYYSVNNAVECIGRVGKMTKEDVDYCRPLLLKLGFKERKDSTKELKTDK